jgi:hypothetical protein
MGGGNGQKSKMARERNLEKNKGSKGAPPLSLSTPCPFRFFDIMWFFFGRLLWEGAPI